jgi:replicative DNA helicase
MDGPASDRRSTWSGSVSEVIASVDAKLADGERRDLTTHPSGFGVIDDLLGGGFRTGELILLGGPPGVGKTIAALQWARNLASTGVRCVFACYEHEPETLLTRLLSLEAGELGSDRPLSRTMQQGMDLGDSEATSLRELLSGSPEGQRALERVRAYADDLILVRASGSHTTIDDLARLVNDHRRPRQRTVLFVDYLQKVPIQPESPTESEKVTRTVESLKDLALDLNVPLILLSAVDAEGMRASRLRLYHLRGSSAIAFESDVVIMLNDKHKAVSKVHLSYDAVRARTFRDWVVFSVEKNRGGPSLVDLEFRKDFRHFRFDPDGGIVTEQLVSERLDEELI